jgi:hypothetical protein
MTKLLEFAKLSSRLEVVMNELKELLKLIVADLEKSAAAINVLQSGSTDQLTALDLAVQTNRDFYASLRTQIDALKLAWRVCRIRIRRLFWLVPQE